MKQQEKRHFLQRERLLVLLKEERLQLLELIISTLNIFIHTVGPVWIDGNHHELEILERCYRLPLQKAIELGCQSIAFPLISTGVYEFPKDKALHIAVSVLRQFLTEHEIEIILVVFDKTSFQLRVRF